MYGQKIKTLRKANNKTQKQISKITGFPQSSISMNENAKYPDLKYIAKVCVYFKVDLWEFFIDDPKKVWGVPEIYVALAQEIEALEPKKKNTLLKHILSAVELIKEA